MSLAAAPANSRAGAEEVEEVVEKDYPVDPAAKFTLQNDDGSVLIYGADIAEMKVQAVKKAYSKERLDKIDINVAVRPGEISVKTGYPPKPKWGWSDRSGTVDYVIILPWRCQVQRVELGNGDMLINGMRGSEVNARVNNGRLFGRNCFTDLHASIGTGGVDVSYEWWESNSIKIETTIAAGNTFLNIPGNAQFRLAAETANGHIFSDFTSRADQTQLGQSKVSLLIGGAPNADMQIHAKDGSIRIKESYQ
jgi:DUF4097 and DUF4098 domain-containing protein YvlB